MNTTAISWTHRPGTRGRTWNPVRGCRRKSTGCEHCYAEAQAARIVRMGKGKGKPTPYDGLVRVVGGEPQWTGEIAMSAARLAEPLRWREPSTVFVDSMSDLFYDARPDEHIAAVFGVMAACPQHTFLVLTKYAARMRQWFEWAAAERLASGPSHDCTFMNNLASKHGVSGRAWERHCKETEDCHAPWPLPNVWVGVSVENRDALHRLDDLRSIPAAIRMVSAEPLLEDLGAVDLTGIGWWITGCESGRLARPCDVEWLRSLRDQCAAAGAPFFLKQANARDFLPAPDRDGWHPTKGPITAGKGSKRKPGGVIELPYLDGVQHKTFPESRP